MPTIDPNTVPQTDLPEFDTMPGIADLPETLIRPEDVAKRPRGPIRPSVSKHAVEALKVCVVIAEGVLKGETPAPVVGEERALVRRGVKWVQALEQYYAAKHAAGRQGDVAELTADVSPIPD